MHYVIVDIETTGGSPTTSKITELAAFKHDGTKIIGEFSSLINPEISIPDFITRLTGISNGMVENAPKFYEIAKDFIEFTRDCIFVAHNVGFDYGMIRYEFKSLGYDFRMPHLCTVRTARIFLPGKESYSLGKLSKSLGITLTGRHRAGGDAQATAEIFTLIVDRAGENLSNYIQHELNPKLLHPQLDLQQVDNLPTKTGVYKLFNEFNQLIYIGKSKQIKSRIEQHLRNTKTKKGAQMMQEIARIEYELTGSELIALLLESQLIKQHKPIYNRRLRTSRFPYGIYDIIDQNNYIHLNILSSAKTNQIPLVSFTSRDDATKFLTHLTEEHALCQKLNGLYATKSACFHHGIKQCLGACIQEEPAEAYNQRVQVIIDKYTFNTGSFFIVGKGRTKSEKSLVLVERGTIAGFGYAPFHFNHRKPIFWKQFIDFIPEDRDARSIVNSALRQREMNYQVVHF